jgi:hypothetical protein
MIVEQPGIDIAFAESGLNRSKVHGQTFIVNDGACGPANAAPFLASPPIRTT